MQNDILSYREICDAENVQTLQRGMNFRLNPLYSVILMSQRVNAPYKDKVYEDGITIEYEGHDVPKTSYEINPKSVDQPLTLPSGRETQNGLFKKAVDLYKTGEKEPERVKVYEKIIPGVWSLKGFFELSDYKIIHDGKRNTIRFILKLSNKQSSKTNVKDVNLAHTRIIQSEIKKEVWKRDRGKCVKCGSHKNLHFDHDLPFSKGGTSLSVKNIRLLCVMCNLQKSGKIE